MKLLESHEQSDLINRKTATLPKYDPRKKDLPKRSDYIGATAWLRAVQACIGEPIVYDVLGFIPWQGAAKANVLAGSGAEHCSLLLAIRIRKPGAANDALLPRAPEMYGMFVLPR